MSKTGTSLGELMTIRDILMGEIIEEYNARFQKMEEALAAQKTALEAKEQQLNEKIAALNALVDQYQQANAQSLDTQIKQQRHTFGAMLAQLGNDMQQIGDGK